MRVSLCTGCLKGENSRNRSTCRLEANCASAHCRQGHWHAFCWLGFATEAGRSFVFVMECRPVELAISNRRNGITALCATLKESIMCYVPLSANVLSPWSGVQSHFLNKSANGGMLVSMSLVWGIFKSGAKEHPISCSIRKFSSRSTTALACTLLPLPGIHGSSVNTTPMSFDLLLRFAPK